MPDGPQIRLPAKLHRRVALLLTDDPVLAEEILARKKLAGEILGRLADKALLLKPGKVDIILEELRKMGHTPSVPGQAQMKSAK